MALSHAILASLLDEPRTGYDLAKLFGSEGYFWRASHQQIYRELARLERDALIAPTGEAVGLRGERRRAITSLGREHLADWGGRPSDPATIKEDVLVKCLALDLVDPTALAVQIRQRRAQHRARERSHRDALAAQFPEGPPRQGSRLGRYLALQGGVAYERAWADWADMALETLGQASTAADTTAAHPGEPTAS